VRKTHPKAKEVRCPPGKNLKQHIQHLLSKKYKVVGEIDSKETWTSDHFSYPSQPIITVGMVNACDSLSERYPLPDRMRKAVEDVTNRV